MTRSYKSLKLVSLLSFMIAAFAQDLNKAATQIKMNGEKQIKSIRFQENQLVKKAAFFTNYKFTFGLTASDEMRSYKELSDKFGSHTRFKQFHKGLEVLGAEYILHSKNGNLKMANGLIISNLNVDVNPLLNEQQAFSKALENVKGKTYKWITEPETFTKPEGILAISSKEMKMTTESMKLVYRFDIYVENPVARFYVDVDAKTGEIVNKYNRLHTSDVSATGNSSYNGTVSFTADYTGSNYRLRQSADGNGIQTFDMNNGTNYNNSNDVVSNSSNFGNTDQTAVQAHWSAEQTHKYFMQSHSRNSFNGNGGIIKSYVHYSSNYVNAFWDGSRMTYGDGDGTSYGPLVSLDIVGHEITHGVTEYSANLVYSYESGALNESFSDIFGESIEYFATGSNDWQMGTDIGIGGSGAIRSMDNPNSFGDPDTYHGTNWYFGSGDNGGVHYNSGVQNKWFYILSAGETGTNDNNDSYSVSGIGIEDAAKIAYRNLSVYLSTNSQYDDARDGAIQSAIDLFGSGSAQEIAVTNAWYAVGVGSEYQGGGGDTTPPSISSVNATAVTTSSATITWTTNEGATSQVQYGTTTSYGSSTSVNSNYNTSHSRSLSGLSDATTYHYRVISIDAAGNSSTSSDNTFTTNSTGGGSGDVEPNNGFSTAGQLSPGTLINGFISSSSDEDYFVFTTSEAGDIHIELANFPGDYDVYLYNSSQSELAKGYTVNDPEIVDYTANSAGTFYVRVDGYNGANSSSDDYELMVTFTPEDNGNPGTPQWYYVDKTIESQHKYRNNKNTTDSYSKSGATQVAVHFSRFETETNYDFVFIKDASGNTVDTYHGTLSSFWAVVSGDEININFVSDYSVRKWGWKIDQVAYYSTQPIKSQGFVSGIEISEPEFIVKHINNEKGQPVNMFASKEDFGVKDYSFAKAFPNPFNPNTNISFFLPERSHVKVEIFNMLGQLIKTLNNGILAGEQEHSVQWNASNNQGVKVSSGVYFYKIRYREQTIVNKLILMK